MHRISYIYIATLLIFLTGCSSPSVRYRNITASYQPKAPLTTPLKTNIKLGRVTGINDKSLTMKDHIFVTALADSLKKSGLLNETDNAAYALSATMQYLLSEKKNNESYIRTSVYYKLIDTATNTPIWADYIETKAYYKDADSFFKTKQTVQQSVQNNLNNLMEKLTNFRT